MSAHYVLDLLNQKILPPKSPAGFPKKNIQRFILRQLLINRKTPSVISQGFILGPLHIYARYMTCLFLDTGAKPVQNYHKMKK